MICRNPSRSTSAGINIERDIDHFHTQLDAPGGVDERFYRRNMVAYMNGLLVRVGVDQSEGGGSWNGPVDGASNHFAYVAIPENRPVFPGLEKPYRDLIPILAPFGVHLPAQLLDRGMHLDPDFAFLTYGDQGERAKQLQTNLRADDFIVFYAGLANTRGAADLVYALIGVLIVDSFVFAADVPPRDRDRNAHSRRVLAPGATDLILRGRPAVSGRLRRCVPIGAYRDRAYRVRSDVLAEWGGLSIRDGYLQRSARLPRLLDPPRFLRWLERQQPSLMQENN